MNFQREKEAAIDACMRAAKLCDGVQNSIAGSIAVEKSDKSPVTIADYGSQAIVADIISGLFPDDMIVAEEHSSELLSKGEGDITRRLKDAVNKHYKSGAALEDIMEWVDISGKASRDSRKWVLDPIDGTKGFLRNEQYAIALALMVEGRIEIGVLACPKLNYNEKACGSIFFAARGEGAFQMPLFINGAKRQIHVTKFPSGSGIKFTESVEIEHTNHELHRILSDKLGINKESVRMDSQAKYGVVARGDASLYLRLQSKDHPEYKQKIWDHAAGVVIVEEAGGRVTDSFGQTLDFNCGLTLKNNTGVIATNGACHDAVVDCVRSL